MKELRPGVWHWKAPHPEWKSGDGWDEEVSSYAIDDGERLVLFDPLGVPSEIEELSAGRDTAIVLTCTGHARDAENLEERLGAVVFLPPPEEDNEDAAWLRPDLERLEREGYVLKGGDRPPIGVEVLAGKTRHDLLLWIESQRALVAGDTLIDRGHGLELPADWLPESVTREQTLEVLRPLLELPVEVVLATHGGPYDRAALDHALA